MLKRLAFFNVCYNFVEKTAFVESALFAFIALKPLILRALLKLLLLFVLSICLTQISAYFIFGYRRVLVFQ